MTDILVKPIITEKMTLLGEKLNRYGFIVHKKANKIQVKNAVESMYGVSVKAVKTMIVPGKTRVRYTKRGMDTGIKSSYKKAIVTLNDGDTIDFYSNI